jgi:hypothetical protein
VAAFGPRQGSTRQSRSVVPVPVCGVLGSEAAVGAGQVEACAALTREVRCRLTRRLQLAGVQLKEEIHLCGGGLGPAAEAQSVRRLRTTII